MSKVGITDLHFHGKTREFFFSSQKEKKIKFDGFFVKIKFANDLLRKKVIIFFSSSNRLMPTLKIGQ